MKVRVLMTTSTRVEYNLRVSIKYALYTVRPSIILYKLKVY